MGKTSVVKVLVLMVALLVASTGIASPPKADDEVWRSFLGWLPSRPPSQNPQPIFDAFREHLLATGTTKPEAERQLAIVLQAMRTSPDGWRVMFNNIYASATPGFSTNPSGLLIKAIEDRKPGAALDVGIGQGRNSVFLAIKGWDVTGFDVSDEGLKIAASNAAKAGTKIKTVQASIQTFAMGTAKWDLIAIMYEPAPVTTAPYVQKLISALRPGGIVVIESFASASSAQARRPVDIDPDDLLRAFAPMRLLHFEDLVTMPEWTKDKTRVVRLVAQKRG